ncbi:MAG TPA: hypothetical protein DEP05_05865 [Betaproteobacteria bacterium]|nr:hypothetical protein [Betaproteobacteria bacterium]
MGLKKQALKIQPRACAQINKHRTHCALNAARGKSDVGAHAVTQLAAAVRRALRRALRNSRQT